MQAEQRGSSAPTRLFERGDAQHGMMQSADQPAAVTPLLRGAVAASRDAIAGLVLGNRQRDVQRLLGDLAADRRPATRSAIELDDRVLEPADAG